MISSLSNADTNRRSLQDADAHVPLNPRVEILVGLLAGERHGSAQLRLVRDVTRTFDLDVEVAVETHIRRAVLHATMHKITATTKNVSACQLDYLSAVLERPSVVSDVRRKLSAVLRRDKHDA